MALSIQQLFIELLRQLGTVLDVYSDVYELSEDPCPPSSDLLPGAAVFHRCAARMFKT